MMRYRSSQTHGKEHDFTAGRQVMRWGGVVRLLGSVVGLALVVMIGALFALQHDIGIHRDIVINRPIDAVWRVIADTSDYPAWNPFITRMEGRLQQGASITIALGSPSQGATIFNPTVLQVVPGQLVCWRGSVGLRGLFDGTHCMRLSPVAGGTRFEQSEHFSGILVGRLTEGITDETLKDFERMNLALKRRVESGEY